MKTGMRSREKILDGLATYTMGCPIKNYSNVDIGPPVANVPHKHQVAQTPAIIPNNPPAPPAVATPFPILLIVVTLLPRPITLDGRKRHQLEAIPEEDEPTELQQKRFEDAPLSDSDTPPDSPIRRQGGWGVRRPDNNDLLSAFGRLALSLAADRQGTAWHAWRRSN
jgi:hypothetical protein